MHFAITHLNTFIGGIRKENATFLTVERDLNENITRYVNLKKDKTQVDNTENNCYFYQVLKDTDISNLKTPHRHSCFAIKNAKTSFH